MKNAIAILCLTVAASLGAAEPDVPAFRTFPNPGHEWSSADGGQVDDGQFSWRHYKHDKTGDVVACVAWYTPSFRAIEYTYVYENESGDSQPALAHGYVVVIGDFTIFIQHTANRVITSGIAQHMLMDAVFAWSKEQTSTAKGWGASISRPNN